MDQSMKKCLSRKALNYSALLNLKMHFVRCSFQRIDATPKGTSSVAGVPFGLAQISLPPSHSQWH